MKNKFPHFAIIVCFALTSLTAFAGENMEDKSSNAMESESFKTYVSSDEKAYAAMTALPQDQPFQMLNMIRYRDKAKYEAGSEFAAKNWSGAEAYAEYGRHATPIAERVGGKLVYVGDPQLTMIGPEHEQWDAIFIMAYPNLKSFLGLVGDPEYKKHAFHRAAGVADSRLIRLETPASQD